MNSGIYMLEEKFPSILKEGFITFCGAGISIPPPSCSPSWWNLTEEMLEAFFDKVPNDYNLPKDMILKDPDRQPEEVFETFSNILDERLFKAFEALDVAEPNATHYALARLAKKGILKACFTTNFDLYLEKALREEGVEFDLLIDNLEYEKYFNNYMKTNITNNKFLLCKVHGSIERPNSIVSIASAYKSAKGFSTPKAAVFEKLLKEYFCLFLGYSGWDFNHLNYRKFWERIGPGIKGIFWNRHPKEGEGPNFQDIFRNSWNVFEFTESELPEGLINAIKQSPDSKLFVADLTKKIFTNSNAYYKQAKIDRIRFFQNWIHEFPESHMLGLIINESQKFSSGYREFVKKSKEISQDTEAISFDFNTKMAEINQKYQAQEITLEEYQQKIYQLTIENLMRGIRNEYKPGINEMIRTNKFPGITDNSSNIMTFLNAMLGTTRWYGLDEAASIAADYTYKIMELMTQTTEEARAEQMILGYAIRLQRPNDDQWKAFIDRMYEEKKRFISGKTDFQQFTNILNKINQEASHEQMGMTIDLNYLIEKQIEATVNSKTNDSFEDQAGALSITIMQMAAYLTSTYIESQVYKDLLVALSQDRLPDHQKDPSKKLTFDILDEMDSLIRKPFIPVLQKAKNTNKAVSLLMEMALLTIWIQGVQYLDPKGMEEYQKLWDSGEYPKRSTPKVIYNYLLQKIEPWLDDALNNLPSRFAQKLCGNLAIMGEMGNDFEFCKRASLKSLELSEGWITEATPENIPGNLAGFYERLGDSENALNYYEKCLDAIKLSVPPVWTDAIVYRTAYILAQKDEKRKALEIIGMYHPSFRGNASSVVLPARKMAESLAEDIARDLGYTSAQEAVNTILG